MGYYNITSHLVITSLHPAAATNCLCWQPLFNNAPSFHNASLPMPQQLHMPPQQSVILLNSNSPCLSRCSGPPTLLCCCNYRSSFLNSNSQCLSHRSVPRTLLCHWKHQSSLLSSNSLCLSNHSILSTLLCCCNHQLYLLYSNSQCLSHYSEPPALLYRHNHQSSLHRSSTSVIYSSPHLSEPIIASSCWTSELRRMSLQVKRNNPGSDIEVNDNNSSPWCNVW